MAKIRSRFQPWGDGGDKAHYNDLRRGAMDDAFWDEDELVSHRRVKTKKRKRAGCPGNDGNEHVYVDIVVHYRSWDYRPLQYTRRLCCGCEKVAPRRRRW